MNDNLARRSHALFMRAVELADEQREAYISEACAGDPQLRRHVDRLLSAIHQSGVFLDVPALEKSRASRMQAPQAAPAAIGKYTIVRTIGVGGMATVYEAIQEHPNRRVAVKVLRHGLAQTSAIHRFRFEAEILARLQHPGVAQIFEAGYYDDGHGFSAPYFAMEFIADAETLTQYSTAKNLSIDARLRLFLSVCDAVQYGHQHGVIHRDLKPGNVLVDARGQVKVIDFGVARASDPGSATDHTKLGQLIGTLNYMSPEQCAGNADIDIRTDVYSLGVLLYELLCDRPPHDVSSLPVPEALRVIREDLPKRPASLDERLRGDLDAILLKALSKEAPRRYPTVAAFSDDVRRHLAAETVEARPPTLTYRASIFVRRHRIFIAALCVVLLALISGAIVSSVFAYRAWEESRDRFLAQQQALAERDTAVWQTYVANISAARASMQSGEFPYARACLSQAPSEYRGWEWRFLARKAALNELVIPAHEDMIFGLALDRNGTRMATVGRDGSLRIWNAESGAPEAGNGEVTDARFYAVAFSPTGETVATASADKTIRLWNSTTGAEIRVLGVRSSEVTSISWAATGLIASATESGKAAIWDPQSDAVVRELNDQPRGIHGVAFAADGARLITWGRNGSVQLRDAGGDPLSAAATLGVRIDGAAISADGSLFAAGGADGKLIVWDANAAVKFDLSSPTNMSSVRSIAFSPDGSRLAAGRNDRTISLYSLTSGQEERVLSGHSEAVSALTFSPDGEHLYSASWDRTVRRWDVRESPDEAAERSLDGHVDDVLGVAFSPSGSVLASASRDKTIRLSNPETGEFLGSINGHTSTVSSVAYSPDGRTLASGSYDKRVMLWNAWTGKQEAALRGHERGVWTVAFSPDGHHLASGGDDTTVRIWNLDNREVEHILKGHAHRVISVAFSPDGRLLASASRDRTVRIWDLQTGSETVRLAPHDLDVFAVLFSCDGKRLFSGSRDQTVHVYDVATGKLETSMAGHGQFITCLALLSDGSRLAAGSWFGELVLWDATKLQQVASFKAQSGPIRSIAFSPNGQLLAAGGYEHSIRVFDAGYAPTNDEARRKEARQAAVSLVDRLVSQTTTSEELVEHLLALSDIEPEVRSAAQREILRRALQLDQPK